MANQGSLLGYKLPFWVEPASDGTSKFPFWVEPSPDGKSRFPSWVQGPFLG